MNLIKPMGFKMNHYKEDNKEEYKEEKNQNPNTKNRSSSLNDLTTEEREEYLQDLLDNMSSYDEDFY